MISPGQGNGRSVVPKKGQQKSLSVTMFGVRPPPPNHFQKSTSVVLGLVGSKGVGVSWAVAQLTPVAFQIDPTHPKVVLNKIVEAEWFDGDRSIHLELQCCFVRSSCN